MIRLTRLHDHEPLLSPRDIPWEVNGILNPGVTIHDGSITLLYRAIGNDNISRLGLAKSVDGVHFDFVSDRPVFAPLPHNKEEHLGVEDPRITYVNDTYAVMYVSVASAQKTHKSPWKTQVSLAWTDDFQTFKRDGIILPGNQEKNAALFPVLWGDSYRFYHQMDESIALSASESFSARHSVGTLSFSRSEWESQRVGVAAPPLYTEDGWLVFYNARDRRGVYRIGALLCDYDHPERVIAKLPYPLLEPELSFEVSGHIPNVVYSCGAVEAGDAFWVYYGGARMALGGAFVSKDELLNELTKYRL